MANSRSAKNLAHKLIRAGRDVMDNVTQPRKAAQADADIRALKLAREAGNARVNPADAAGGNQMAQRIVMARGRRTELRAAVQKRKNSR